MNKFLFCTVSLNRDFNLSLLGLFPEGFPLSLIAVLNGWQLQYLGHLYSTLMRLSCLDVRILISHNSFCDTLKNNIYGKDIASTSSCLKSSTFLYFRSLFPKDSMLNCHVPSCPVPSKICPNYGYQGYFLGTRSFRHLSFIL